MIINHNISALNTHRQLTANNNAVSGSLEKLSSGLKINRAGDDAAGLAISEKMRGQIRGLDMATKNAQDGISLIQTAEGALNETHSILQRMRELAVQSSNDTNTDADRAELQNEVDALAEELSRIADNTEFNTQNLLGGKFEATFHIGANEGQNLSISIDSMDAATLGVGVQALTEVTGDGTLKAVIDGDEVDVATGEKFLQDAAGNAVAAQVDGKYYAIADVKLNASDEFVANGDAKAIDTTAVKTIDGQAGVFKESTKEIEVNGATISAEDALLDASGNVVAVSADDATGNGAAWRNVEDIQADGKVADGSAELTVNDAVIKGENLGAGIDISSQAAADAAITTIQKAVDTVSSQRSALGAVQNRLEHTINNLGASSENLTAAESRIRDVDMAQEMMEFTKNNILTQAAQAMLAQANQTPQGVLQLLR